MARAAIIPQSPPKRTTRGRPKATTTAGTSRSGTASTTKPSKPVTKTTRTNTSTSTTETRKRTTRTVTTTSAKSKQADSDSDEATDDEIGVIETKEKAKPGRPKGKTSTSSTGTTGRGRKPATTATQDSESDNDDDELAQSETPKKRPGRPRTRQLPKENRAKPETVAKPRGRPRATTATKPTTTTTAEKDVTRKKTRAKTGADEPSHNGPKHLVVATNSTVMRSNLLRGPAKKKKVTFQNVSDSEEEAANEPSAVTAGRRRAATTSTRQVGLGAKPVRKPATTTGRGRKPAATKKEASKPLSPKKANQVTKSISSYASSDGEDDELSGAKDQIKLIVNSPLKHGSEATGLSSPVRKINFTPKKFTKSIDENGEPILQPSKTVDFSESLFMSSPARRPTPSPFHYTVKETPRRARLSFKGDEKPLAQPNFTPIQNSPLKAPPKKAHLETPRHGDFGLREDHLPLSQPNFTPGHNSPLKSFPKKGIFSASFSQVLPQESMSTPFKSRSVLIQSPAKRVASPFKSSLFSRHVATSLSPLEHDREDNSNMKAGEMDTDVEDEHMDHVSSDEDDMPTATGADVLHDGADEQEELEYVEDMVNNSSEEQLVDAEDQAGDSLDAQVDAYQDDDYNSEANIELINEVPEHESEAFNDGAVAPEIVQDYAESHGEQYSQQPDDDHMGEVSENDGDHLVETSDDRFAENDSDNINFQTEEIGHRYDMDNEEDPDATESEPEEEPMDYDTYGDEEVEANPEQPNLPFQQNTEGLEDVFIDADVDRERGDEGSEADFVAETPRPGATEVGDIQHDEHNDEYVDFHDSEYFDDDEATLVAFDTTDHYIYDTQPDAHVESQFNSQQQSERRTSPAIQQHSSPQQAEVASTDYAISYHGGMDYREDEEVSDADVTTDIRSRAVADGFDYLGSSSRADIHSQEVNRSTVYDKRPRFTLLAEQLSQWNASSPEKSQPRRAGRRGIFSLGGLRRSSRRASRIAEEVAYPDLEDSLASPQVQSLERPRDSEIYAGVPEIYEDQDEQDPEVQEADVASTPTSHREPMSELYSEPQQESTDPTAYEEFLNRQSANTSDRAKSATASPSSLFEEPSDENKENEDMAFRTPVTPIKRNTNLLQTFHTVSKVPLRPEGQVSPLKLRRKRGRSLSMTSPVRSSPRLRQAIPAPKEQSLPQPSPCKAPTLQRNDKPRSRLSDPRRRVSSQAARRSTGPSVSPSPSKTSRKSATPCQQALSGAVVFVDVYTTEGEDASGIFIELLQQMGARCVKSWGWNPRSSICPSGGADRRDSRIGITHVVFKDGGVRTLEKVRQAAGLVKCVGVGWVLDCERENKWLDESHYTVDSSIIPRGGAKRRKSMEPRALSNVNGTLVKVDNAATTSASRRQSRADWNPVEDFKRLTPPVSQEEPKTPESNRKYAVAHTETDQGYCQTPKTPGTSGYDFSRLDNIGMSPATPFYLSQRSRLVQQTCPPKQTRQGLFSTSSSIDDEPSQSLRFKLEAARRKSLAFKPKVGSPLIN